MSAAPGDEYLLSVFICTVSILLVPLAIAGLATINTGLGRARSAAHAMTSSLCVVSVAVLVYFVCGFKLQGYPAHLESFGGVYRGIVAEPGWFFVRVPWSSTPSLLVLLLGIFSAGLVSVVPLGAAAERWRLSAACASTVVLAGWTYPFFARLAWHQFLAVLDVNFKLAPFVDAGGAGAIQVSGGLTALSLAWLVGPRHGKYSAVGMPAAIPAHNGVLVLFGALLAWIGWLGLNSSGAILYLAAEPSRALLAVVNTTFSAAAAALAAAAVTRIRFRKPDASLIANGWLGGLVASSAGCATLKPATAILTGLVAGALVVLSVEQLEFGLKIDDPCGSISVHAIAGIWGLLAAGMLAGGSGQLLAQLIGIATLVGLVLPMSYALNWLLGLVLEHRVSAEGEHQGMDLYELGADAYPEFVVHTDEFIQR